MIVCPLCHKPLQGSAGSLQCQACRWTYLPEGHGYTEFVIKSDLHDLESTTDDHVKRQEDSGAVRLDEEYILPFIRREPVNRVLDVGCGVGRTVSRLLAEGVDAYGIDLPCLARFWQERGLSPKRFFISDAVRLPFPDGYFDSVISLGVIEHIGTLGGEFTMMEDFHRLRQKYADELLRVTRQGGRILVTCPNKRFPVDPQHTVKDVHSPQNLTTQLRDAIYQRTHLNIHRIWGKYHLLSYSETRQLFCGPDSMNEFTPLPVRGYFALDMFKSGWLRPFGRLAGIWINNMPGRFLTTWVNPYMIAQIRKR